MILLVEPVCSTWVHEEVNAGFLQLITDNSDEEIVYIGEKRHIHCVRKLFGCPKIHYVEVNKVLRMEEADFYKNTAYYFRLMNKIVVKYKPEKMFILCGYRPCILASELNAFLHRKVRIYFVLHGMIEERKGHKESYMRLFRVSKLCKGLCFISYSPYCTGKYWGVHENKFVFLHHPYVRTDRIGMEERRKSDSDKIIIGVIGACANDKAVKLITSMNQRHKDQKYEFWVISRFGKKFKPLDNVRVLSMEFERKEIERMMQNMNYLLLPYGRDEYSLSASGVLWDAIVNKLPCLMLDSKYFEYYMAFKIGYQAETIEQLCRIICEKTGEKKLEQEAFFVNLDKIAHENKEKVKHLLQ